MILKNINLINFRNYKSAKVNLNSGINIFYGDNAQGKTNLLESVYVLALTKSHKSYIDNNLVFKGKDKATITGTIIKNNLKTKLEVSLKNKEKILKIDNNIESKINKYVSNLNIIFFYPEDLELIKGNPVLRRKYLNTELSQLQTNYMIILNDYNKLIKIKNLFLKTKKLDNKINYDYFEILNNHIIKKAIPIYILRNKYINKINFYVEKIFFDLTGLHNFEIKYKTGLEIEFNNNNLFNKLKERLENNIENEVRLKKCLVGPHLDDIEFYLDGVNLKFHGSQGQQRIAVLAMKLAEVEIFKQYSSSSPILLLDDVFSELDNKKKNKLIKYIDGEMQSIITTTDLKNINKKLLINSKIFKVINGNIEEEV
ncbi:MAG: DNA replication/repair protein RecF [Clostridium sp.]|nr:DNA replication/repair protein RecF [Clostridium sp.]MCM1443773.1 DNA replication/repair protein RecF [Candidatus Amulumruptor caecigallinarius]